MPDDIWRALQGNSDHFWIKKDGTAIVEQIDLTQAREEDIIMTIGV